MSCLVATQSVIAIDPDKSLSQFMLRTYSAADGLPQDSTLAVAQTPDRYLWLGTQNGVARFDGHRFIIFDSSNTPAIRSNFVTKLETCADGSLWLGTDNGLVRLRNGHWTHFNVDDGLPHPLIQALACDSDNRLWVGTRAGLASLETGDTGVVSTGLGEHSGGSVLAIAPGAHGRLWIGTETGLLRLSEGGQTLHQWNTGSGLPHPTVTVLVAAADGGVFAGTEAGLVEIDDHRIEPLLPDAFAATLIRELYLDRAGTLFIGTDGGLFRWNGEQLHALHDRDGGRYPIRALHEDHEGNIWVGLSGKGVARISDALFTVWGEAEGLSSDRVFSTYQTRDGAVWIGTFGGGLNRLQDGNLTLFGKGEGLAGSDIWTMQEDIEGQLWISLYGRGLQRFDGSRFRSVSMMGRNIEYIRSLFSASDGSFWIGTRSDGVFRKRHPGADFEPFAPAILGNKSISALYEDRTGAVWIPTMYSGVFLYKDNALVQFNETHGLPPVRIYSVHHDSHGTVWLGSKDAGLYRFKDGRFTGVTREQGLFDNTAYQILEDDHGHLWLNSNLGIYRVAIADLHAVLDGQAERLESRQFNAAHGLHVSENNGGSHPSAFRALDGAMWFPTLGGAARVHPVEAHAYRTVVPPVLIESVRIDGQEQPDLPEYVIPPATERIDIRFTAISFKSADNLRFRYRVTDFNDGDWIEFGTQREISFTRLPPGNIACNWRPAPWPANGTNRPRKSTCRFNPAFTRPHCSCYSLRWRSL